MTFLGSASERNLFAIPGLDYVAHEDVIPYTSSETTPIQHELFQKFLAPTEDGTLQAQSTLHNLLETNHPYLELCDVHKETTENIRVTVMPFYMGFREQQQKNSKVWWVSTNYVNIKYLIQPHLSRFFEDVIHCVEIKENYSPLCQRIFQKFTLTKKIFRHINFFLFSRNVTFTKFLPKKTMSKFPQ